MITKELNISIIHVYKYAVPVFDIKNDKILWFTYLKVHGPPQNENVSFIRKSLGDMITQVYIK
jgi:hypothetical protein